MEWVTNWERFRNTAMHFPPFPQLRNYPIIRPAASTDNVPLGQIIRIRMDMVLHQLLSRTRLIFRNGLAEKQWTFNGFRSSRQWSI